MDETGYYVHGVCCADLFILYMQEVLDLQDSNMHGFQVPGVSSIKPATLSGVQIAVIVTY